MNLKQETIFKKGEKEYKIGYKNIFLKHSYNADFIVHESIILEVKASSMIINVFVKQTIHYLKTSGLQLGIIANFSEPSFVSKSVVF